MKIDFFIAGVYVKFDRVDRVDSKVMILDYNRHENSFLNVHSTNSLCQINGEIIKKQRSKRLELLPV